MLLRQLRDQSLAPLRVDVRETFGALELRLVQTGRARGEQDVIRLRRGGLEELLLLLALLLQPLPTPLVAHFGRTLQAIEDASRQLLRSLCLLHEPVRERVDRWLKGALLLLGLTPLQLPLCLALDLEHRDVREPLGGARAARAGRR